MFIMKVDSDKMRPVAQRGPFVGRKVLRITTKPCTEIEAMGN